MADRFSVVICAYTSERWPELTAAIDSVRRQSLRPGELIVVVDHNEPLQERLREWAGSDALVIDNHEAAGLSGARNSGIEVATEARIAFLDDDAEAAPDWLARLDDCYHLRDVMGAGGGIEPVWPGERPGWFPDEFDWVVGCTYRGMPRQITSVRNLLGCNMSFCREALVALGGFRHGIGRIGKTPLGCEETELCIRAQQRWPDRIFLYDPRARVEHRVTAARASWDYFRRRCYAEGLSKAQVAKLVGANDGLASERSYASRLLPQGIARGLVDAVRHRDGAALGRAAAIAGGLGWTAAGYIRPRLGFAA